ncbi:type II secretion system protein GspG [Agrobacterium vitis]|uniref:Type II secretion system core protein G n=1 Tax=Agrobacterium vitis TaxID=373 RepID=A0A368NZ72_AGRVI|nr:type II secretion system major pseudopilin GspG [Agrobacterium vitis]KAA3505440.1 type II secretion system protein GspG [Agrobacterium vitis]KAA3519307.1 type II secretion system protein GspG [Agrobacterium vitis]MCF1480345.1 type II secretion system protein GspG [Agrobacterium vitis]MUZ99714.1 type II secretion system protein GspG [Agrobacterium vitis]MVA32501.1 type II secretion system protein GspG [Agrobacterium vitis]
MQAISADIKTNRSNQDESYSDAGFSLVELLVVVAIMGLLIGLVAPRVLRYLDTAKVESAKTQIHNIQSALELYYLDTGTYPSQSEGLSALSVAPASAKVWNGPYLKGADSLKDPWGHVYVYKPAEAGQGPLVISFGRDGKEGGDGEDHDLP